LQAPPPQAPDPEPHSAAGFGAFLLAYPSAYHPPPRRANEEREMSRVTGPPQRSHRLRAGSVMRCSTSKVPQLGQEYS